MLTVQNFRDTLEQGGYDEKLSRLYCRDLTGEIAPCRERLRHVVDGLTQNFRTNADTELSVFSAPGRTELGGNHTDHQHGRVLAASVDLDVLAAVVRTDSGLLRVQSEGYPLVEIELGDLAPRPEEINTTAALLRGVAARFAQLGCSFHGAGLDAYVVSNVPGGSGLSSSAAFEVLIGTIINELYFDGKCTAVEIAQIGQYAENNYFGKPCGLMDQTACSVGGVVAIDFLDPARPVVERIDLDLRANGYAMCILDSGAGHGDLTGEYAAITGELRKISGHFGREFLRDVPEADFAAAIPALRELAGDRAVLRAMHYFAESDRVLAQAQALKGGDFNEFLRLISDSGKSSAMYLQNVIPTGRTTGQELMLTIALCEHILAGRGAARVHGGGFGGTAQAFVPLDMVDEFKSRVEAVLGEGSCHILSIRPVGGVKLA